MPTGGTLGIMAFDTALDRLIVSRRNDSAGQTKVVQGTRTYQDDGAVLFRARMTTGTTVGSGSFGAKLSGNYPYAVYPKTRPVTSR